MLEQDAERIRAAAAALRPARRADASASATEPTADELLVAALRLLVTWVGLGVFFFEPSRAPALQPFVFAVLALFTLHATTTYIFVRRGRRRLSARAATWLDLAFTTALVAVSRGTSTIYFPLYLFVVLSAAFRDGFRGGMRAVAASVLSFAVVGGLAAPAGAAFERDRAVIRALYLLVLGYLVSELAEHQSRLRARLTLLRDCSALSNPRFGIDRTLGRILCSLRDFYRAESCRLVVVDARAAEGWTRAAPAKGEAGPAAPLPAPLARVLLPDPLDASYVHDGGRIARWRRRQREPHVPAPPIRFDAEAAAEALGAGSFLTVAFQLDAESVGRIYVVSRRAGAFDAAEAAFVGQVLDQLAPVLHNVRLVDRLASEAAEQERRRIARDVHDAAIQPLLGLRLGLAGPRRALADGRPADAAAELERLSALADEEVERLRAYVRTLSSGDAAARGELLPDAVRRFCGRFADATGIAVRVHAAATVEVGDRLAAEVFQMVAEALANVRRHSEATRADVQLDVAAGRLRLSVENDGPAATPAPFSPRSLSERAGALGGTLAVRQRPGTTAVAIEIPL